MVWIEAGDVELGVGLVVPTYTNFISGFWMDAMEVTIDKWREVYTWATNNSYSFSNAGSGKTNGHPVNIVNWYDCVKWCNARSQMEGLKACYYTSPNRNVVCISGELNLSNSWVNWDANGYRLPTDTEWEKAARGGCWFNWANSTRCGQREYLAPNEEETYIGFRCVRGP